MNQTIDDYDKDDTNAGEAEAYAKRNHHTTAWGSIKRNAKAYADITGLSDPKRMLPIIQWLPRYSKEKLIGDFIAGVTVGLMVIPQSMAYANLAGLPPAYGLYSSFMGVFVYAIFGTAKDVSVGPTALMSLIVAESFSELEHPPAGFENQCSDIQSYEYCCQDGDDWACTPVHLAVAATLISGLFQIGMGFLNFGVIVDYIGFPVFNGFTTAAAITIATSQFRHILGVSDIDRHWMFTVRDLFKQIHNTRWQDVLMGLSCMLLTYWLERVKAKYNDRRNFSRKEYFFWLCGTARNAIVVVLALCVARIVAASDAGDEAFKLVYDVPAGVPKPEDPLDSVTSTEMSEVLAASIAIALLGYLESIAIGKSFAQKNGYELDPTQEMRAIGYGSVISSFFLSYPITGSFSRTAVNSASSVFTPLGGIFTGICVIFSLEVLTPAFYYIPKAALAAIIIMSVVHMIDVAQVRRIAKVNPQDLVVWLTSFLACLLWSLEFGILLAIVVSGCLSLYNQSSQSLWRLKEDEQEGIWVADARFDTAGLAKVWAPIFVSKASAAQPLVVKIEGDIVFAMGNAFKDRMVAIAKEYQSEDEVRAIVIDMSGVGRMDYSGVLALEGMLENFKPGVRRRVALGGERGRTSLDGDVHPLKKGDVQLLKMRGVRVHLAYAMPKTAAVLRKANLLGGNLKYGEWKMTLHPTIQLAIHDLEEDFQDVDQKWPFDWMVPKKLAKFFDANHIEEGRGEEPPRPWRCYENPRKKKDKRWVVASHTLKHSVV